MGDPFLCLLFKTPPSFFFFNFSHSFLHNRNNRQQLRPPLRFAKPHLHSVSLLISTTECLDGSFLFRFGDESEKAAFDDEEAKRILEEESNVDVLEELGESSLSADSQDVLTEVESEGRDISGVSAPGKLEIYTLKLSKEYPSILGGVELAESEAHTKDDMQGSTPRKLELHTSEGSDAYPSVIAEDKLTEGKGDITDVVGASTPTPLELQTAEGSEVSEVYPSTNEKDELREGKDERLVAYLSVEVEDKLTEGKGEITDVAVGASIPTHVELHTSEGSEENPSIKAEDEITDAKVERPDAYPSPEAEDKLIEGKGDRTDVVEALTPTQVEFHTSEVSAGYPSTIAEVESTERKLERPDFIGASTSTPVEFQSSKGSEGDPSTKSEDEVAEGKGDQNDVTEASIPIPVELSTSEDTKRPPSRKSKDEITEGKERRREVRRAKTPPPVKFEASQRYPSTKSENLTEAKEHRTDVTGASTPRTVELDTVESSEEYPSTKSKEEFASDQRDVPGASTDKTEDMHSVEAVEGDAPMNYENEINDKTHKSETLEKVDLQIVDVHLVKYTNGYPSTKTEDQSTESEEQREITGASTPKTLEPHTVEGTNDYASKHDSAEGTLDRTDVSKAAIPSKVELHTVENAEDTSLEKSEDEFTEDKAVKSDVSGVSTPTIIDLHTVEEAKSNVKRTTHSFLAQQIEGDDFLIKFCRPLTSPIHRDHVSASLLRLSTGAALLPHPSKASTGGEDAYFIACGNWLGVADGVSEWSLEGIYPGVYARELMENCERLLSDNKGIPLTKPEDAVIRIASQTKSSGSSTVLVGYFDGQAFHVANIGNSGFIIIRNGRVFKRSSPLIHGFNFPIQIVRGVDPSELIERYSIDLDEGDVIVTATDGLFDNLYDQEITSIVTKSLQRRMNLQDIAKFLATSAQEVGQSTSRRSPFADAVEASGYVGYTGGKLDDVTVIVSHVHKQ